MKIYNIILFLLVFISCTTIYNRYIYIDFVKSDSLRLEKTLKNLNGYYFSEFEEPERSYRYMTDTELKSEKLIKNIHPIFFYKNGDVFYSHNISAFEESVIGTEVNLNNNSFENCHKNLRNIIEWRKKNKNKTKDMVKYNHWGHYKVLKDSIYIMYFYSTDAGMHLDKLSGIILNDSTLVLYQRKSGTNKAQLVSYKFKKSNALPEQLNFMEYINNN